MPMPRTLTLSGYETSRSPLNGKRHIEWYLMDKGGRGYYISWLERAFDTGEPECMAFKARRRQDGVVHVDSWNEEAVSYEPDAALALEEVVKQLTELYDVTVSVGDPATALKPGEVVAGAQ